MSLQNRKTFKEILAGSGKITGKAIKSETAKFNRKEKMISFVEKYGRGDHGLSAEQKLSRIEKFLGKAEEIEKVKGLGLNKSFGVDLSTRKYHKLKTKDLADVQDQEWDPIEAEILTNIEQYPQDFRALDEDLRIVFMEVKDNGEMEIEHVHNNEQLGNHLTRQLSGLLIFDDETSARNEILQYKNGELKEVSDRTMAIHEREGVLDILLEADNVDTDEDKELQI